MLLAWAAFLAGVTPGPGVHFSSMQLSFVQLATPLLLLGADLRGAFLRTRRLGTAFLLGSAATVAGALAAYALLSPLLTPLGAAGDSWKLAAALAAKNIGGGLNYVAVASVTGLSPAVRYLVSDVHKPPDSRSLSRAQGLSAGLVIDNIAGLLYFPLCSFLGRDSRVDEAGTEAETLIAAPSVEHTLAALALSCSIVAVSRSLAPSNALPLATAIAVAVATAAPQALRPVAAAGDALGTALLYLFFATAGASAGDPGRAAEWAPFFVFVAILYGVHLSVLFFASRALGFSTPETLLASNANIGGPATAAALADAQGWARLRTPAVLVGTLGNAVATFIALALGYGLLRKL